MDETKLASAAARGLAEERAEMVRRLRAMVASCHEFADVTLSGASRDKAMVLTKLDEADMWAERWQRSFEAML